MWETIIGRVPAGLILFCTFLAGFIPFFFYMINYWFHKHGDPPWKKE